MVLVGKLREQKVSEANYINHLCGVLVLKFRESKNGQILLLFLLELKRGSQALVSYLGELEFPNYRFH